MSGEAQKDPALPPAQWPVSHWSSALHRTPRASLASAATAASRAEPSVAGISASTGPSSGAPASLPAKTAASSLAGVQLP